MKDGALVRKGMIALLAMFALLSDKCKTLGMARIIDDSIKKSSLRGGADRNRNLLFWGSSPTLVIESPTGDPYVVADPNSAIMTVSIRYDADSHPLFSFIFGFKEIHVLLDEAVVETKTHSWAVNTGTETFALDLSEYEEGSSHSLHAQAHRGWWMRFLLGSSSNNVIVDSHNVVPITIAISTPLPSFTTHEYIESPYSYNPRNPERGEMAHTQYNHSCYGGDPLREHDMLAMMDETNFSVVSRLYFMHEFMHSELSQSFLDIVESDFAVLRSHGFKMAPVFAYSDEGTMDNCDDYWNYPEVMPEMDAPLDIVLGHIAQLGPVFAQNADVLLALEMGFVGIWGEWHHSTHFENASFDGVDWHSSYDMEALQQLVETFMHHTPEDRFNSMRYLYHKQEMFGRDPLNATTALDGSYRSRIGHVNWCLLSSDTDFGAFREEHLEDDKTYLAQETKYVPMFGEGCMLNPPRSDCPTALEEMERFHYTCINNPDEMFDAWEEQGCLEEIKAREGYRLVLRNGTFSDSVTPGSNLLFQINFDNIGYAAPINPRSFELVLRDRNAENHVVLDVTEYAGDARTWYGGMGHEVVGSVMIPSDLALGSYDLLLVFPDPQPTLHSNPDYSIKVANEGLNEEGTGLIRLQHTIVVDANTR